MKVLPHAGVIPSNVRNLLFVLFFLTTLSPAQTRAEPDQELTLAEFRTLLPDHPVRQNPFIAARADEIFFELLSAQEREAAARQSLDRLAGWAKAAQARLEAESAPALDVGMLRFAEAKAEARVERFDAQRLSALSNINLLLSREPDSPLRAVAAEATPNTSASDQPADKAGRIARAQQLLAQAQELLAKVYQNYLFGGVTLTTLLWQEDQVYQTELQYRLSVVEAEQSSSAQD